MEIDIFITRRYLAKLGHLGGWQGEPQRVAERLGMVSFSMVNSGQYA